MRIAKWAHVRWCQGRAAADAALEEDRRKGDGYEWAVFASGVRVR